MIMKFEAIKAAVMNLDEGEQRRVVLELLPEIWPQIVGDDSCIKLIINGHFTRILNING